MLDFSHIPSLAVDSLNQTLADRLAQANTDHEQIILTAKGAPLGVFIPLSDAASLDDLNHVPEDVYAESVAEISRGDYMILDQILKKYPPDSPPT